MNRTNRRRGAIGAVLGAAAGALAPTPARADVGPAPDPGPALVRHCVTEALTEEQAEAGVTNDVQCTLVPAGSLDQQVPAGTLAVHWDYHGGGASLTVIGSSCTGARLNIKSTDWWNNRISSTEFMACGNVKHYTGASWTGDNQLLRGSPYVLLALNATLNNQTSSIEYAP